MYAAGMLVITINITYYFIYETCDSMQLFSEIIGNLKRKDENTYITTMYSVITFIRKRKT